MSEQAEEAEAPPVVAGPKKPWWVKHRWVFPLILFVSLLVLAWATGVLENVDPDEIRDVVESAGAWGIVVFVIVFCIGSLMQLPGWVFISSAVLLWGFVPGMLISFGGSIVSVTVSFLLVRFLGGRALTELKWKWARKVLARLDERPVITIVILRIVFGVAPVLTYSLAMTNVTLKDHTVGSVIGLIGPVIFIASGVEYFPWIIDIFS